MMQMPQVQIATVASATASPPDSLDPLVGRTASEAAEGEALSGVKMIRLDAIRPSRLQPRRSFDQVQLQQLADSIKHSGLMQPIIVRRVAGDGEAKYELVAGERRWRAAALAGLSAIPALDRPLSDEEAAEWGLVENIQREDLNPMDRAFAIRGLLQRTGCTQEELGGRIGLDRATVANLLRLCELEDDIATLLADGRLSGGHGRALLAFPAGEQRVRAANMAAQFGWSVRKIEQLARERAMSPEAIAAAIAKSPRDAVLRDLERQLGQHLGTKVTILADKQGKRGRLSIEFYGIDHFDGLLAKMGLGNP
jgi:ParB family chromosome partitioning protein